MTKWSPSLFKEFYHYEQDACGIVACIEKRKIATRENIFNCIDALILMNHRAGFINGEGDGVGIHIDIPRELWMEKLSGNNVNPQVVFEDGFIVGHIFISSGEDVELIKKTLFNKLTNDHFTILFESDKVTSSNALGPIASKENPIFWQFACVSNLRGQELSTKLFETIIDFEQNDAVHVASLSQYHAVYKVLGAGDILPKYYHDLQNPLIASAMTLGHNRFSTNTLSSFFRVQPFSILGHNGEINTITKLREEATMIGVPLVKDGSDSQDLSRTIETLICRGGYTLFEAMELLFPPIINEIKAYPAHLQDLYTYMREAWGHFAQGPAGIVSRFHNEAVFSVDALGLRPLWMIETEKSFHFSSEPGIIPSTEYMNDPKPLAPGEKIGMKWDGELLNVYTYSQLQEEVFRRYSNRLNIQGSRYRLVPPKQDKLKKNPSSLTIHNGQYKAFGWSRDHIQIVKQMAEKGVEPIRSLGHDSPLAALTRDRKNLPDFIKESVAVVTNPAIDRDREIEHFSTRIVIGKRPSLFNNSNINQTMELISPILMECMESNEYASELVYPNYSQLFHLFNEQNLAITLSLTFSPNESIKDALNRLSNQAVLAVQNNFSLLILDDEKAHQDGSFWIDPHLAVAAIHQALVNSELRRDCSLLLRSAAIRSLHDCVLAIGFGADIISPYYMFTTVCHDQSSNTAINLYTALTKGLEKVISTLGIHELRGYSRLFSSIGLHEELEDLLQIVNFFGSADSNYNLNAMKEDAILRSIDYQNDQIKLDVPFRIFPRIWKTVGEMASTGDYQAYRNKITLIEDEHPTSIRHLTELTSSSSPLSPHDVDISIGNHDLPFVISSMSFGSQNEIAFRAYAEGANRLNMVSLNGEGGEIKDMLGKYPNSRGQQIASGRFGVNAELIHSSNLLEIKIGQGAKPGEGGHLPGSKVTAKIAEARNATIGSDLISPSNNHDIYSIEDLAQMIYELKAANAQAKVAVKVPIVPNIGTIAIGIAKAGADIITLSGFDGGTGAARIHALQHVGLPVEIGVKAAHNALLEVGLRNKVELWADGGIKSAKDVLKVMLLGANRIGFGTLSMMAIGCTTCQGCHLDTCHVGIATQIESVDQAREHGLRRFVPRQLDLAVQGIVNLYSSFGRELKELAASIGIKNLQDAVGRSDLLIQKNETRKLLDLSYLLKTRKLDHFTKQNMLSDFQSSILQTAVGASEIDFNVDELPLSNIFTNINSLQRSGSSSLSGYHIRKKSKGSFPTISPITLNYQASIPGNGLGAYNSEGINITVDGGAQDGVGKTSLGGSILIFKSKGKDGHYYNGSVGKSFGYGAQRGLLVAQGDADARAGIRLSGADMIIGGFVHREIPKHETGNIGANANIKGFAFEYMTNGRGLVLGDPGPWICAGMTGGAVYLRHDPEMGLTKEAIQRRISKGAKVSLTSLSDRGKIDVEELLGTYIQLLKDQKQEVEAFVLSSLLANMEENFLQISPIKEQADPSVSTE